MRRKPSLQVTMQYNTLCNMLSVSRKLAENLHACHCHCFCHTVGDCLGQDDFCNLAVNHGLVYLEPLLKSRVIGHCVRVAEPGGLMHRVSVGALAFSYMTYHHRPRQSVPCCEVLESRQMADSLHLITCTIYSQFM